MTGESEQEPIRAELFSAERLEQHAQSLAAAQAIVETASQGNPLVRRSRENGAVLLEAYNAIDAAVRARRAITPASEWLVDNFHIVQEQLRAIEAMLPTKYYRELPKIAAGHLAGLPRVYGLAWAFIAHTDSRFDPELLTRFVRAYQRVQHLDIGEIWALPIMLRVVMIENLRRLAALIHSSLRGREWADRYADELLGLDSSSPANAPPALTAIEKKPLERAFAVQLIQRLRYQDPKTTPALQWLDEQLAAAGADAEALVLLVHNRQASANLTVRNVITSMRLATAFDWNRFFEEVSLVDAALRSGPGFAQVDSATRNRYRRAVEQLARRSPRTEIEVAQAVADKTAALQSADERRRDPGYYLISAGRPEFEQEIGYSLTLRNRIVRACIVRALPTYLAAVAMFTLLALAVPLAYSAGAGVSTLGLALFAMLALIPASDIGLSLANRLVAALVPPRHLPRLELAGGIPAELRTMVVVPTFLGDEAAIHEQLRHLETHYLCNAGGEIHFALLTDWADAAGEHLPGDQLRVETAVAGIRALNQRYGTTPNGFNRFHLFHRRRLWNPSENKWMGWERKRGKLHELNRLLRGARDTSILDDPRYFVAPPRDVRFVVTLDADTISSIGSIAQLIGTIAHPLNRPRFDARSRRVLDGYGILQPRITATLPARRRSSIFQRIFSGRSGVDPYTNEASDIYQDLFGRGSFTGKGLYEVDAFEASLAGRTPENSILSHDLFEGIFANSGLVSDVEFFEEFPFHTEVASSRQHRWARGDWQLLPWVIGGESKAVPPLGRWKMADNLRRSASAPMMVLTLLASWLIPAAPHNLWLAFAFSALFFPHFLAIFAQPGLPPEANARSHARALWDGLANGLAYAAIQFILLAHHAWIMADAIVRTLYRIGWSRRKLLEWTTAAQAAASVDLSVASFLARMRAAIAIAAIACLAVALLHPAGLAFAAPVLLLWATSPFLARRLSQPPPALPTPAPLTAHDISTLRLAARRTWRFFATFVTRSEHHLPPDNFQEDPEPVVAHRTSPTNYGLYLLSTLAARDFGWIGLHEVADRLEATLATLESLPRFHGHFVNWIETSDLRLLEPKYVSTVDSGNLAGFLIAAGQASLEFSASPFINGQAPQGLRDALALLGESLAAQGNRRRTEIVSADQVTEAAGAIDERLANLALSPLAWAAGASELETRIDELVDMVRVIGSERREFSEPLVWAEALGADLRSHRRDIDALAPWAAGLAAIDAIATGEAAHHWTVVKIALGSSVALDDLPERARTAIGHLRELRPLARDSAAIDRLIEAIGRSRQAGEVLRERLHGLARRSRRLFDEMDFRFLFDPSRQLFSIGYQLDERRLDASCYDLLASEARLASYIAIAKGEIASSHWFRLGRRLVPAQHGAALASWSGSMFEYLMPALVMASPPGSLLEQTSQLVVARQIGYGEEQGVPWGVSESAYHRRDLGLTYQYSAFGVPGLGLKRGLSEDIVIAPYATALAAAYAPNAAAENFRRLKAIGGLGQYGFYEALDFTGTRLQQDQRVAVIRAYMAHHQGMILVSIANVLYEGVFQHRFHREPIMRAAELLLQETTQHAVPIAPPRDDRIRPARVAEPVEPATRRFDTAHLPAPASQILSNSRYAVMITSAGSGYSRWQDLAVTRWREDRTRDAWGSFLYLRDAQSGKVWSAGYQPVCVEPDHYEVLFVEDRASLKRLDSGIESTLVVLVSGEDDAEVRRLTLRNASSTHRQIEVTSYAEIVLNSAAADLAHPAFSNLFVETEYVPEVSGLLASRRPRSAHDKRNWAAHVVACDSEHGAIEFETDRARFIGRGRTPGAPLSVIDGRALSNTVGPVLDPVFSLRVKAHLEPGATVQMSFCTMAADSREAVFDLADKYHVAATFERVANLAWTQAQVQFHHLGIEQDEAHLFQRLANRVLYMDPMLRPGSEVLKRNRLPVSRLWGHRISGDRPIVLARIEDADEIGLARQLLQAHEYWRMKRLAIDLVILNDKGASYLQDLQTQIEQLVQASQHRAGHASHEAHGEVFVLRADLIPEQDLDLLATAARAILVGRQGSLAQQVFRMRREKVRREPWRLLRDTDAQTLSAPALRFFNGLGGFSDDGREYVVVQSRGSRTPAPWINVVANDGFGFQASESGSGYTWSVNSRENQLTPWSNDPVYDPPGEAFYLRDAVSGAVWTPTALPIRVEDSTYIARFGAGYCRFEHSGFGVRSELFQFVPVADSIKVSWLTLENRGRETRRLTVTAYVEWVLGFTRSVTQPYIVTEIDEELGAVFACNPWDNEFGARIAFAAWGGPARSITCDRGEFLGRHGYVGEPAALAGSEALSGRAGAGLDPCAALQTAVTLRAGEHLRLRFLLGQAPSRTSARELILRYRGADLPVPFQAVADDWDEMLSCVQVETPDESLNLLLNRWLLYQSTVCRSLARAAFYQAGGAYGFRDQLQDAMAFALARPQLTRAQIVRASARQFPEGDVQHWWHPPSGRGVRTRFSDDRLWLPFVTAHYLAVTSDSSVLDQTTPFLEGEPLAADQEDRYFQPQTSQLEATVYEHCARAIEVSLQVGQHGLPLIGCGDWNDGMNRVGIEGKGESVWLGWFLYATLQEFAPIAARRGDEERAKRWLEHAQALQAALEREAWDGAWYRRAYYDDGTALGSASNIECRIDSLAQSWAVISGAADPVRARRAMDSVEQHLTRPGDDMILLFTPPFNRTERDPGYIKGYLPGVRENGAQYTHAAVWCVIARALLGDGDKAFELMTMLNPTGHGDTRARVHRYKVEPYVVAADVYAEPPHVGRGGWTWYTGAAGWMYRAGIEYLLGLRVRDGAIVLDPCIPREWKGFKLRYRHGSSLYEIAIENPNRVSRGVKEIAFDGRVLQGNTVPLSDDGQTHRVQATLR